MIVENLNMLLGDLASDDEAWKIRHTLMNEPRLMLLASATNRFEHFENSSQAMFEMFKMHELAPLDDDECNTIWELITGRRLEGEKIRPIRILTGGNPRLLTIIAKFGAGRSFGRLLDDLVDLIDDHTEYFKSHLDNLPATERKAYLALAELWDLSTAREIAKAARLDVNTTSSLLNRLAGRGAITVERRGKRTGYYAVAERMYNIYYLMRRRGKPADRVKAAVKFMVAIYGAESATRLIAEEACGLAPEYCRDHYLAYAEVMKDVGDVKLLERIIRSTPKVFLESPFVDDCVRGLIATRLQSATSGNTGYPTNTAEDEAKQLLSEPFSLLIRDVEYERAIEMFDSFTARFGGSKKPGLVKMVVGALVLRGMTFERLGKPEEAIGAYDAALKQIEESDDPGSALPKSIALVSKGGVLETLGRSDEAIEVYDKVVQLFGDSDDPDLAEYAAEALYGKGTTLGTLGRSREELKAYNDLIARFGESKEPSLAEWVARALVGKGTLLCAAGNLEDAIVTMDYVVERFGGKGLDCGERVVVALAIKGVALVILGRHELAEESFREAIRLDPESGAAHPFLIKLLLEMPERQREAMLLAEEITNRKPDDAALLSEVSWAFYEKDILSLCPKCEYWARRAVSISPDDSSCNRTLACILAALGKGKEALGAAGKYVADAELVQTAIRHAIRLFVELASSGHAKESLDLLENSPAAAHLEPLIAGLKIYNGEDVKTAVEILEVAKDVVRLIEDRKRIKNDPTA